MGNGVRKGFIKISLALKVIEKLYNMKYINIEVGTCISKNVL